MPEAGVASGLSAAEAAERLRRDGPNELPQARPRSAWRMAVEVLQEPMLLLLAGCSTAYFMVGDLRDALALLVVLLGIVGLTLYQQHKTERALEALRDLSSPRALVIRDGARRRIAGREVVRGDLLVLGEGDRIAADGLLLDANHLGVDESLLTGESVPVRKRAGELAALPRPGPAADAAVYSGTLVTGGGGVARVAATGAATELGRIGRALQAQPSVDTPLQVEIRRLVRRIGVVAVTLSVAVGLLRIAHGAALLDGVLAGLTLAMSLLPEEFPVALTIFLALGARRISRQRVLARRIAAVETLGAVTVLCADKTGTLTENRMRVQRLVTAGGETFGLGAAPLPEAAHRLVEFAILATRRDPFDPMEQAIQALGAGDWVEREHLHADWTLVREYPLAARLLAMSEVWQAGAGGRCVIAAKGAPESILELCHLDDARAAEVLRHVHALSEDGLRVLAVAEADATHAGGGVSVAAALPVGQHDFAFRYLGLLALADPVRSDVPAAVAACRSAGIRVLMITGDHPGTARSIARQAGLPDWDRVVLGDELEHLDAPALARRLRQVGAVARARPEHKLRIVQALQQAGEVVGMTGDGINDAPALRAADIGVAMGGRGTDVAREAAGLVVTDDDFSSIVHAVRLGRRIFANLQHAMGYIVAVHVPIAGIALLPAALDWPLLLLPAHIAFLELVINPACSVVFEAEPGHPATMRRPPRSRAAPLLGASTLGISVLQGLLALAAALAVHPLARSAALSIEAERGLVFAMLVAGNLALIVAGRSRSRGTLEMLRESNATLWQLVGAALACLALALGVPLLRGVFHFALPPPLALAAVLAAGVLLVPPFAALGRAGRPAAAH